MSVGFAGRAIDFDVSRNAEATSAPTLQFEKRLFVAPSARELSRFAHNLGGGQGHLSNGEKTMNRGLMTGGPSPPVPLA